MLSFHSQSRIFLYRAVTDMRKSFNGLSTLVQEHFPGELLTGSFFLFCNRCRNRLKILYWDGDGFALWYKHLEKGSFKLPGEGDTKSLNRRELMALLEGVKPLKFEARYSIN